MHMNLCWKPSLFPSSMRQLFPLENTSSSSLVLLLPLLSSSSSSFIFSRATTFPPSGVCFFQPPPSQPFSFYFLFLLLPTAPLATFFPIVVGPSAINNLFSFSVLFFPSFISFWCVHTNKYCCLLQQVLFVVVVVHSNKCYYSLQYWPPRWWVEKNLSPLSLFLPFFLCPHPSTPLLSFQHPQLPVLMF